MIQNVFVESGFLEVTQKVCLAPSTRNDFRKFEI